MRKAILMMLLFASHAVMADWTPVGENDSFTHYADHDGILKEDKRVKMLCLTDFKTVNTTVDAKKYLSMIVQNEFDCQEGLARLLKFSLYSANMGKGSVVISRSGIGKWNPVSSGSVIESFWKVACEKR